MVKGGIVNHWICVNFASRVNDCTAFEFCQELAKICSDSGMTFQRNPVMLPIRADSSQVESVLKAMTRLQGKELDLLIVILPDKNGSLYGDLKLICKTDVGLVYQCCYAEHVLKDRQKHYQYIVNLSLKINVKVGGRNTVLADAKPQPQGGEPPYGGSTSLSPDLHQAISPYQPTDLSAPTTSKVPFGSLTKSLGDDSSSPEPHLSSHDFGSKKHLGEGLESRSGFQQSIRPTQMGISLNIDVSLTAFIEPLPVIEYVAQLLNKRDISSSLPLSDADHVKIKKALRGIMVEVTHRGEMRSQYRISGLTSQATWELTFPVDERGTLKSVVEYFHETYKSIIHYTWLPCLLVGNQQRPVYLPMEVCKIVPGQRYSKRLNKGQIAALLQEISQRPQERKTNIIKIVDQIDYAKDEYAREFGTEIIPVMAQVAARVLPAPQKVVNGGIVNHWICVNFASRVNDYTAFEFCQELAKICSNSGMTFQRNPVVLPIRANSNEVESVLKAMTRLQGKELDLLIVILPDKNGSLYGDLKRICETDLGLVYQCCLAEQVLKDRQKQHQYLVNLSLKINVKVGGRNTVLADAPCIEGEGEEGHVFPLKH